MESYKKCGVGIILKHIHGPGIGTEIKYQLSKLLFTVIADQSISH